MEKTKFLFAIGFQLERVSGFWIGACVNFYFKSRTPSGAGSVPAASLSVSSHMHQSCCLASLTWSINSDSYDLTVNSSKSIPEL